MTLVTSDKDMVWVPGGTFRMGSDDWYPEERPVHAVSVDGFWMDEHQVTVAEFRRFVKATGYVTLAERPLDPATVPRRGPGAAGARRARVPQDARARWTCATSATGGRTCQARAGTRPEGPGSTVVGRDRHPVTQVAYEDAEAYAAWAGKELPTEAEWEFAARGGLDQATYTWGDEFAPRGRMMANTWQGEFPWQNLLLDRYEGTSPVKTLPAQRLRALRHGRQRLGVDVGLLHAPPPDEVAHACCAPRQPARRTPEAAPASASPERHPATGDQGWLPPVRAQLLPPLSTRRAAGRGRRHLDRATSGSAASCRAPASGDRSADSH